MNKKNGLLILLAGFFLCAGALPAFAQEGVKEEKQAEAAASEMESAAKDAPGQNRVAERIKAQFGVDDARVQSLRAAKLGYGEISLALALAQGLPGGITDENVQKVLAARQGPPKAGWGKVAKDLGLKLGPAISKVKKAAAEARKAEKGKDHGGKGGKADKAGGKPEGAGKPEKADRPAKADRPEKGGRGGK